jgi:hypothetical protein
MILLARLLIQKKSYTYKYSIVIQQTLQPVIIPRGYTKKFIEGEITHKDQIDKVMASFESVNNASDITLMEGTGHCAGKC